MSQVLTLFLKIIHERTYRKLEKNNSDTKFGFRIGLGTTEARFTMQVLVSRCQDVNVTIYACFIDYEKAFDRIKHDKDIRLIAILYWNKKSAINIEDRCIQKIKILRGLWQGFVLSPLLFNCY